MKRGGWNRTTGCGMVVFLLCGAAGLAQTAPQANYTFHETVRRVVIDVVVTDKSGHDIHGLKQRDFEVFENNKRENIRSFEERRFEEAKFVPPKRPKLPPETYTNLPTGPEGGPLYVIVYDLEDMGYCHTNDCDLTDQEWARKQLAKFLAKTPTGSRFALFLVARQVRLIQGFTTDRQKLLDVFDVKRKDEHVPWVFLYQDNYPSEPWHVLAYLGRWLEGLPGRKNVIWLASKFPVDLSQWETPDTSGEALSPSGWFRPTPGESYAEKTAREAIDLIDNAHIALYPIDMGGAGTWDPYAIDAAKVTGGHAYDSNRTAEDIEDATENGDSYYEISYAPTSAKYDRKLRKIRVELTRRGYSLEYRRYYFADGPKVPLTRQEKRVAAVTANEVVARRMGRAMYAYMQHGAPEAHQILFRVTIHAGAEATGTPGQMEELRNQPAYFVRRRRHKAPKPLTPIPLRPYTIDYAIEDRTMATTRRTSGQEDVLEFAASAFNDLGAIVNTGTQYTAGPEDGAAHGKGAAGIYRASQTLEVPTTAAWLRVGVRDVATNRIGTIEIRLPQAGQDEAAKSGSPQRAAIR